ncbi:ABC transporter ATP-binding protein [Solwaraspora sp. WMMD791]|uniref:ABC transporter ATP-binding protein n=1 Tax=Solwaraspora sp. WMMD791 TaxID=3016086 RepID=UPI00249AA232|nr:ABC transporter ATP-binding protein [Solwaraspora sp. WMMD791]WFE27834.1 ABC transporter ATP-binding protein [Solwaraspora sp. WMMD791]
MSEVTAPYWRLETPTDELGPWQVIRGLPDALGPALRLIRQAAPRAAVTVLVLHLVAGVATTYGLVATAGVLERLFAAGPTGARLESAVPALALVVLAFATRAGLEIAATLAQARIAPAVRRLADERLVAAGLAVELTAFDDPRFLDRMFRARDRGLLYLQRIVDNLVEAIGALLAVTAAAVSLTVLHPVLLPILLVTVLPDGWAALRAARLGYASNARLVALNRRVSMVTDLATEREPAAEVRATQAQDSVLTRYRQAADLVRDEEVAVASAQVRARARGRALAGVALGGVFAALWLLLDAGWIPLAVAGTALIATRTAVAALARLVRTADQLFEQGLYVADFHAFLADAVTRTRAAAGPAAPAAPQRIELRDVGFHYPGSAPVLHGVNLTLHCGQTVALVGENGSGKTTLAKIIAGLYRPTAGSVTWDGTDLATLHPATVADRVMMVLQDPVRWPDSARLNVRMGRFDRADPHDEALRRAARQALADEVVDPLPQGWDTLLTTAFTGGVDLSGGQWQRLAVARGLFRDAPVLIWDEPTAPLDARAEYAVYEALRRLAAGRTVVLITHRLASVRNCDRIYLMHDGEIVEQGSHQELLALGGRYAELSTLQARMAEDPWLSLQPR